MKGRVAIITGAASGIGRATAEKFCGLGAQVVGIDRQAELLAEVAASLPSCTGFHADLTDHAALERCVRETLDGHGKIDILVNNAGIEINERIAGATMEAWHKTFAVNLDAMYVLARLVAPHMIEQRFGRIVNVSSVQASMTQCTVGAYAATKGAILSWTRSLAIDLGEHGILVNAVAPGDINTPFWPEGVPKTEATVRDPEDFTTPLSHVALRRAGKPGEVADAIAFLCGDECTYITGSTLTVDGGLTIML